MHSASSLLHDVYGRPAVRGDNAAELVEHVGQCWHCGADIVRAHFASTWDQIYGDGASWKSNPWVWRIGFKRIEVPRG